MSEHEEGGKLIDGQALFEQRRREHEINKMAEFYLTFKNQFQHYLALAKYSHEDKLKFERNCKGLYDRVVRKMVENNKKPYTEDFAEFLKLFEDEIMVNPVFTTIISRDILQLLQHSHDSL